MADEPTNANAANASTGSSNNEPAADQLTDDLAKKYDPERLLRIMKKRAGRGERLDQSVRSKYERRFGVDLGHVRVVTGEFAEEFNKQRNAYAVTIGSTGMILMGNSPDRSMASTAGQALLAHELTHVAQAKGGMHRSAKTNDMQFAEEHEEEAEAVEHEELHGGGHHDEHGHDHHPALGKMAHEKAQKEKAEEQVEKIKARVMEMAAEAAQSWLARNGGSPRRP